jgi:hypothetical protein
MPYTKHPEPEKLAIVESWRRSGVPQTRFAGIPPVSLIESIDGRCAEVERCFGKAPMNGHVFVFLNRWAAAVSTAPWVPPRGRGRRCSG